MFFIKYDNRVLSTPYETREQATAVKDTMSTLRQFTWKANKQNKTRLDANLLSVIEKDIDATKRGHKNAIKSDLREDAQRQLNNLVSLIYKDKKKEHIEMLEDSSDRENMKAIHGSEWQKYMCDSNGICQKDEERYKYRFKVSKKPTLREIVRFTGLNIYQVYLLQEKTKLYPEPRITKAEAKNYLVYVDKTGDTFSTGFNFSDDSYLEEYATIH